MSTQKNLDDYAAPAPQMGGTCPLCGEQYAHSLAGHLPQCEHATGGDADD